MSVVYITTFYPSEEEPFRGHFIEKQALIMKEQLNQKLIVFKLSISGRSFKKSIKQEIYNGIEIYTIYYPNFFKGISLYKNLKNMYSFVSLDIKKILNNEKLTLIVSNDTSFSLVMGNLLQVDYDANHYCIVHGEETNLLNRFSTDKRRNKEELLKCDKIVAVSKKIEKYINRNFGVKNNIIISGNGLPTEIIHKYMNFNSFDSDLMSIVSVGNITYNKGFDIVIEALRDIEIDYIYYIIGEGPYEKKIRRLIKRYKMEEKVIFLGNIDNSEIYNHLEKSTFFILPSRNEAFGIVYLEAMITGNIVIGSEGQGCEDFIENGVNGFLVNNSSQICEILETYETNDYFNRMKQKASKTASEYSWIKNVRNII